MKQSLMSELINIVIHSSQFPAKVQSDLRLSLRSRRVNHKFHYDSYKQTQRWLDLHQACSPSRTDPDCAACYDASFGGAAKKIGNGSCHVIGLGCGGGQKDARVLGLLAENGSRTIYAPVDVSTPMVLVACEAAAKKASETHPLVCDLLSANDLAAALDAQTPKGVTRLITFFGMIPNFEPQLILPTVADLLRPSDLLLFSANLAPGTDYPGGVKQILPQYDNLLTRNWLLTFLIDLGVEQTDGALEWRIESCPSGADLLRLAAWFRFGQPRTLRIAGETFEFVPGNEIRLFFSYRYTPARVRDHLSRHGLVVQEEWITASKQEGVFLCHKS